MSSNDILFSRGVANATIIASGTKLAAGVIANPLSAPLADVDFEVFGSRGLKIPISNDTSIPSTGVIRYNTTSSKLEFATGSTWESVVVSDELSTNQLQYVVPTHYVADKKLAIIPGIGTATSSDVSTAITLDIKSTEPHTLMRNISSVEGKSSLFMLGGTGNVTAGAVNGFELQTTTNNTAYGSKLEINPIVQSGLSTTMKSVTITPHGTTIESGLLSLTSSITSPTLNLRGSAHTNQETLKVDKVFIPGLLSAFTDSNKIATFSYATQPVLEMLATSKLQVNGATGAVLAMRAVDGANPGYLAKFSQGGYTGTDMDGIFIEISNSTNTRNLAIFNGNNGGTTVSAAKLDSTGTLFLKNHLSVGGNMSVGGVLSVTGLTRLSNLSVGTNANIGGVLSVSGLTQLSNLSVTTNSQIGGSLSVFGSETITGNLSVGGTLNVTGNSTMSNVVVGRLSVTTNLSVSALNTSTITVQNLTGQTGSFGNLTVTGSTTFGSITYTDLSVSGNLSVGGSARIGSTGRIAMRYAGGSSSGRNTEICLFETDGSEDLGFTMRYQGENTTAASGQPQNTLGFIRHDSVIAGEPALIISRTTGNVGIGTTSLSNKLSVDGNISVGGEVVSTNTAKAWVRFNAGSSMTDNTTVTIAGSYNISSVTLRKISDDESYNISFTNALPNTNYAVVGSTSGDNLGADEFAPMQLQIFSTISASRGLTAPSTTGFRVRVVWAGTGASQPTYVCLAVFGS